MRFLKLSKWRQNGKAAIQSDEQQADVIPFLVRTVSIAQHGLRNFGSFWSRLALPVSISRLRQRPKRNEPVLGLRRLFLQHHLAIERRHTRVVRLVILLRPTGCPILSRTLRKGGIL